MENILKLNEVKDIVTSANLLTKPLHDVPIKELAAFILLAADSDGGAPVLGWMPAMLVDVASIYCMAKAGEAILERRKIHKTLHPLVAAVVDNVSKISARIRCYHKAISSNTANASKAVWDRLVEFTQSQSASVVCPVTAAQVDAWEEVLAKALADMSTSTEFVLENAVVKILDDNCVEIRGLALHAAQQPDGDGAIDGEEEALSKSTKALYTTLSKCLCELLRKHSYHADIISDHLQATVAVEANTIVVDAGEGEIAQKIHDDVFYTDVDNHPEPLALLWMTCSLAKDLSRFEGSHEKWFSRCYELAKDHMQFWVTLHVDITPECTYVDKLRRLVGTYRKNVWITSGVEEPSVDHELYHLQTFVRQATDSPRYKQQICKMIEHVFRKDGEIRSTFSRELLVQATSLPSEAQSLVTAGKSFDQIEEVAVRIKTGKAAPTLNEMADILYDTQRAVSVLPGIDATRKSLKDATVLVSSEFSKQLLAFEKKVDRMNVGVTFYIERCGAILACIPKWDFGGHLWVSAKSDATHHDIAGAAKIVDSYATQHSNLLVVARKLQAKPADGGTDLVLKFKTLADKLETSDKEKLCQAIEILAHSMLLNAVLTAPTDANMQKHCSKTLHHVKVVLCFPIEKIQPLLYAKLHPAAAVDTKIEKTRSDGSTSAGSRSVVSIASTSSASAAEAAPQPSKKTRRFG
jgi:hypothetical protein